MNALMNAKANLLYAKINAIQAHYSYLLATLIYTTRRLHIYSGDKTIDVWYTWDNIEGDWIK